MTLDATTYDTEITDLAEAILDEISDRGYSGLDREEDLESLCHELDMDDANAHTDIDWCPPNLPGEWRIMGEDAMEQAWDDALQSYLDDCILPEMPECAQRYFDEESWKRDAKFDGPGHALSSYDGNMFECSVGGIYYHIVRTN
jgi:hypothetical protein